MGAVAAVVPAIWRADRAEHWDKPVGELYLLEECRAERVFGTLRGVIQQATIYSLQSGRPQPLPGNVLYVKEAKLPAKCYVDAVQLGGGNFVILRRFSPRFTPFGDGDFWEQFRAEVFNVTNSFFL